MSPMQDSRGVMVTINSTFNLREAEMRSTSKSTPVGLQGQGCYPWLEFCYFGLLICVCGFWALFFLFFLARSEKREASAVCNYGSVTRMAFFFSPSEVAVIRW